MAIVCAFALSYGARAGPPYQTDDPEPVALGKLEINVATQQTLRSAGRFGSLPGVEINYGGAQDLQLHVGLPLSSARPASGSTRFGPGDIELGAKFRFAQETERTPMLAIYPTYLAPTGDAARGLGNGRNQLLLPVWAQKSVGPWTADAGAGYLINRAAQGRNSLYTGLLVQRRVTERLVLGGELFHRTQNATECPPVPVSTSARPSTLTSTITYFSRPAGVCFTPGRPTRIRLTSPSRSRIELLVGGPLRLTRKHRASSRPAWASD